MNFLVLGFWVITVLFLGFGALWGMGRGLNRAILRLVLVIICAFLAFFLRETITNAILNVNVGGTSVQEMLSELVEDLPLSEDLVVALVKLIAYIFVFLISFYLFRFISWIIVYPICKIWVKKGPVIQDENATDGNLEEGKKQKKAKVRYKKRKGWGALVGLGQGVVLAICICMPIGCLVYQADVALVALNEIDTNAMVMASADQYEIDDTGSSNKDSGSGSSSSSNDGYLPPEIQEMLDGYANSVIGKFYGEVCKSSFDSIASVKTENGKMTLIDFVAIAGKVPDLMEQVEGISAAMEGVDFTKPETLDDLKAVMKQLDEIKGDLPDSAKQTLDTLIKEVVKGMLPDENGNGGLGDLGEEGNAVLSAVAATLEEVNFSEISFENEIDVVQQVMTKVNEITENEEVKEEDIAAILNTMADSNLIVPLVENLDGEALGLELDEETKASVAQFLDDAASDDAETQRLVEALKGLLQIEE